MTIDDIARETKATHVSVNNPVQRGIPTKGTAQVESFQVEYDGDCVFLWVTIKK